MIDRRPMVALQIERLRRLAQNDGAFALLLRLDGAERLRLRLLRQTSEVLLDDRHRFRRFHVAHDGQNHVRRHVVLVEEFDGVRRGDRLQVGHVPDTAHSVRMGDERRAHELLEQAADRTALDAHPPLFHHHVALFVELAQERRAPALRLQVGPELEAVRRHGEKVCGDVRRGERIESDAAGRFHDLRELVRLDELVRFGDGIAPRLLQLFHLRFIATGGLAALAIVRRVTPWSRLVTRVS